jgi:hypothetical protein
VSTTIAPGPDVAALTVEQLETLIENHRRQGALTAPLFGKAVTELARRRTGPLDLHKTLALVRAAAAEGRFLSYGEVARAQSLAWDRVRYQMNEHLGLLAQWGHQQGLPMLSAMIVNQENVATGAMNRKTLEGFVRAAEWLGYRVGDQQAFLREQQQACFAWGKAAAAARSPTGDAPPRDS